MVAGLWDAVPGGSSSPVVFYGCTGTSLRGAPVPIRLFTPATEGEKLGRNVLVTGFRRTKAQTQGAQSPPSAIFILSPEFFKGQEGPPGP